MTEAFALVPRRLPGPIPTGEVTIEAPPVMPVPASRALAARLLPVLASVATVGFMAAAFASGSAVTRNPAFLAFPVLTLASMVVAGVTGSGSRRGDGGGIDAGRADYLDYLCRLRQTVTENAAAQCASLNWSHPGPDTLWTLIGGPRMWERRTDDSDFCRVRVGVGTQPLATRLIAPKISQPADPVTAGALRRFIETHSTITGPATIDMRGPGTVTIEGDATAARGLVRAVICQLAVLHPPNLVPIVGAIGDHYRAQWDWLKWLPHNQHPTEVDAAGSARMVYPNTAEVRRALAAARLARPVVVADLDETVDGLTDATVLVVCPGRDGAPLTITRGDTARGLTCPDRLDLLDALVCARRLAGYRAAEEDTGSGGAGWPNLVGIGDVTAYDPAVSWRSHDHIRLRVAIGTLAGGAPLELDIKEPAENGIGPHGLCIGATGSGKSELLRTIALGMVARNSPELLNLLLIDFKGGATFLDLARAPHVAAVITNLADEAPLVARMREALAGEMERRQRLLRAARCVSVAAYERARDAGQQLTALPTLFIIVDEFSELLCQQPDFAETFVAIGRLGRSLGMHLLLASQRLDEGRLRGLEAHLSYRICLKTLSAGDSRAVLGTLDAYELPNTPGAGFLRCGGGELVAFQSAFVSAPLRECAALHAPAAPAVRPFSTDPSDAVAAAVESGKPGSLLDAVVDRLAGHGPSAHAVWLPPLGRAPALRDLLVGAASGSLTVPIGVVDRPREQCRSPLIVELSHAAGNVAVVGAPRSGKSTAVRTLITALAATHDAGQVQFYCLDFGGGSLTSLRALPHVGAVAGRAEPPLVARIVTECESVVRRREAVFGGAEGPRSSGEDPFGEVFLVIDGWAGLRQGFAELEASVTALAAQGLSFGVHVVLTASRWAELRPSLKDQIGTRIELRLGDPADSEIDRRQAVNVPRDRPGRGLSMDGQHMLIATPIDEIPPGRRVAPPIPLLPAHINHDTVVERAGAELGAQTLLGVEERRLRPVAVDFGQDSHLLILGDNGCGKSTALRVVGRDIVRTKTAAQALLLVVDYRRSLLGAVDSEHLGGYATSPPALQGLLPGLLDLLRRRMPPPDASQAQLRARSWWSGPDVYLLVDDYDLVATPAGNPLLAILEYLPHARDLGLHLLVARRSGGAERALFEPLLAGLRDLGCMALMMSGGPDEGAPFGAGRPARLPPGRGVLTTPAGDQQLIQVGWSPP
jgi:S-DNA-T family DNA segregation ATPase FtsK/SpoIIIE